MVLNSLEMRLGDKELSTKLSGKINLAKKFKRYSCFFSIIYNQLY